MRRKLRPQRGMSLDDLGPQSNLVIQLAFLQVAQRGCVSVHDGLGYDVVIVSKMPERTFAAASNAGR